MLCSSFCQRIFFLKLPSHKDIKNDHFTGKDVMTAIESVVLVDENNQPIGTAEKLAAHQQNLLHRAFSVFIFREVEGKQELLLQQRALTKYHSPGLWTNTCCSHPRADEEIVVAGKRRLEEELGISAELTDLGWFHYNAHFPNGLSENEIDHVLYGTVPANTLIVANRDEVHDFRWISLDQLHQELAAHPTHFTPWLAQALQLLENKQPIVARLRSV